MSYSDDEEVKTADILEPEDEDEIDLADGLDDPIEDDLLADDEEDDDDFSSEFAGLDGSSNDY